MRVLTVLEILQLKERVSADELTSRLEVSKRTVQRYIARLQDLGIPVTSTRGRGATYRLKPSFRMPPLMFNREEAFTVALGLKTLHHIGLAALTPAVTGVKAKLERTLPPDIWHRMQALSTALQLEELSWIEPVDTALVTELATAIASQIQLDICYTNYEQVTSSRRIEPLGILRDADVWFLAAYCLLRQDLRLFRVDRVQAVQRTNIMFTRPANFDIYTFVRSKLQNTPRQWPTKVWLDITLDDLRYELLPANASVREEAHGVTITCGVDSLESYAAQLLAFHCQLNVCSPPELTEAFQAIANRATCISQQALLNQDSPINIGLAQ